MINNLRLICILAHPDDESLGVGGTLANYVSEGIETFLITAIRGQRGRVGEIKEVMGLEAVGRVRESELREAHQVSKLYYTAWTKAKWDAYKSAFRDLKIKVDEYVRAICLRDCDNTGIIVF